MGVCLYEHQSIGVAVKQEEDAVGNVLALMLGSNTHWSCGLGQVSNFLDLQFLHLYTGIKQDTICIIVSIVSTMKCVHDTYITGVKNKVSVATHLWFKS